MLRASAGHEGAGVGDAVEGGLNADSAGCAELLADVYLELIEARQAQLGLAEVGSVAAMSQRLTVVVRPRPVALLPRISDEEREAHRRFVATLGANPIWRDYLPKEAPQAAAPAS